MLGASEEPRSGGKGLAQEHTQPSLPWVSSPEATCQGVPTPGFPPLPQAPYLSYGLWNQ